MTAVGSRMSLEEFLRLPERKPALEYEHGVVTRKVSPKGRHSKLQFWIADQINHQTEPGKIAFAFPELRATFATLSRVPDVAVFRWDRIPRDEQGRVADDFFDPPDVAIEILSPGQRINAQIRRCISFLDAGVGWPSSLIRTMRWCSSCDRGDRSARSSAAMRSISGTSSPASACPSPRCSTHSDSNGFSALLRELCHAGARSADEDRHVAGGVAVLERGDSRPGLSPAAVAAPQ
jgi:hypothetical protein